jgi:hypothetical protein
MFALALPKVDVLSIIQRMFPSALPWALLVLTIGVWWATSRPTYSASQALNELQRAHQLELAMIAQARDVERAELEANVRAYESALQGIARDHQSQLDELNRRKVQRTTTLSRDYSGDPDRLAEHMSRVTHIPVVRP